MNVWFRVVAIVVMIFTPSILFVLFMRFLDSLRDDQLVDRVLDRLDESGTPRHSGPATVLTGGMADGGPRKTNPGLVVCDACGNPNPEFATYCGYCTGKLDGDSRPYRS